MTSSSTGSPAESRSVIENRKRRARDGGFTLIEILIAFAILAVALAGLLRVFSGGLQATARTERYGAAVLSARSLLERVGSEIPLQPGERAGRAEDGTEWSVRMQPVDTVDPDNPFLPYEVAVTVVVAHEQPITLTTLRLAPREPTGEADEVEPEDLPDVDEQP
jgi:general secretion pathway protein I